MAKCTPPSLYTLAHRSSLHVFCGQGAVDIGSSMYMVRYLMLQSRLLQTMQHVPGSWGTPHVWKTQPLVGYEDTQRTLSPDLETRGRVISPAREAKEPKMLRDNADGNFKVNREPFVEISMAILFVIFYCYYIIHSRDRKVHSGLRTESG